MKAVQMIEYGGLEVLVVSPNVPEPVLKPNQVLVQNHAASINPFDYKLRSGVMQKMIPLQFPVTMGGDFSGVITKLGEGVSGFSVGNEIYGQAIVLSGASGAFAEIVAANTANIAIKPKNINFVEAASLPLVGASAVQALIDHINLQPGQRILIHGGAGGIGTIAIQIAKALGAYVATTVSTTDMEYAKSLGADEVIDFKTQAFETMVKNFDAVYDTVGGETMNKSLQVLKKGGILVSMLGKPADDLLAKYDVQAIGQNSQTNTTHLDKLREFIEAGTVKAHVDKVFPLDQTQDAFRYQETSHPRGKVVLSIME